MFKLKRHFKGKYLVTSKVELTGKGGNDDTQTIQAYGLSQINNKGKVKWTDFTHKEPAYFEPGSKSISFKSGDYADLVHVELPEKLDPDWVDKVKKADEKTVLENVKDHISKLGKYNFLDGDK